MQSLWMLVASFLFSIMGVGVKLASSSYSVSEIVAYRGLIGMIVIFSVMRWQGEALRTHMPLQHFWRGFVGVVALWLWFFAIGHLPLAMAVTLNYMSPIWIALFLLTSAWVLKKRRVQPSLFVAIVLGFVGVILLLRPSLQREQIGVALFALLSGMLSALAYLQVRLLGMAGEPENRVVFYFSATCALAGTLAACIIGASNQQPVWHAHSFTSALLLLLIGLTAAGAQVSMTRAYRLGNPLVTANLQYVGIVFSSIWDLLIWNDALNWMSWLGIIVILSSGIWASVINRAMMQAKQSNNSDQLATLIK